MAEISLEHSRGLALVRRTPSNAPALENEEFDTEKNAAGNANLEN